MGKEKKPVTAAAAIKTAPVYVADALGIGKQIRTDARRVLSSFEQMVRAHQIDEAEQTAAEMYRDAYDMVTAQMGGALDFDRARGAGGAGGPTSPGLLLAAERLNQARGLLYERDHTILFRIVGRGEQLADCTDVLKGNRSKKEACREVGRRLREALEQLADKWVRPRGRGIQAAHADGAIVRTGEAGQVQRGKVAHAARHRVRQS